MNDGTIIYIIAVGLAWFTGIGIGYWLGWTDGTGGLAAHIKALQERPPPVTYEPLYDEDRKP